MYNPIELVYIVVFYLYKFLSSKSRTLESLWYKLDGGVFNPELIRIEKHSILGLFGITRILNKTTNEREYLFKYLSYQSIINMNNLHSFRTMMVYLKENGKVKQFYNHGIKKTMKVTTLISAISNTAKCSLHESKAEIQLEKAVGILKMNIVYGTSNNRISILGIPNDILLMLDGTAVEFRKAVDAYIKHYHSVSYRLITNNKII